MACRKYATFSLLRCLPTTKLFRDVQNCRGFCAQTLSLVKRSTTAKTHDWNRAVSDAEKIVGYPTTYFSLKCLLSDEFANIAQHLRKLVGTSHPIMKTAKRLIYHGRTNMQTRGLIVLLLSKAAGHASSCSDIDSAVTSGVTTRQQTLAELTEMIHTAHLIHKGILNLSPTIIPDENTLSDLQFGNKISILSGDYLLANACQGLANLRNCKVVDLISRSIGDFMQAEFIGDHDKQGNSIPVKEINLKMWEEKNYLTAGSLIANSCKSAMELAGQDEKMQAKAFEFGKNLALAWQVYSDLQPFVDSLICPPGSQFDLMSLPVVLHLEKNPHLIDFLRTEIKDNVENLDFKALHATIMEGDSVKKAQQFLHRYSEQAEELLSMLEPSASKKCLHNIINSIKE